MPVHLSARGATLIEVLIAMVLLSITTVGLLHVFFFGFGLVGKAGATTHAIAWVQAELEYLRGVPAEELVSHRVMPTGGACRSAEPCLPSGFAKGIVVVRRPTAAGIELPGIREVSVAIFAKDQAQASVFSAATWLAERR